MHGGLGGVGSVAIQVAKALGARVVTTVGGPEKAARVRELRTRTKEQKAAVVAEVRDKAWPMIEDGSVRLLVEDRPPMDGAAEAHRRREAGGHTGKVLLPTDGATDG